MCLYLIFLPSWHSSDCLYIWLILCNFLTSVSSPSLPNSLATLTTNLNADLPLNSHLSPSPRDLEPKCTDNDRCAFSPTVGHLLRLAASRWCFLRFQEIQVMTHPLAACQILCKHWAFGYILPFLYSVRSLWMLLQRLICQALTLSYWKPKSRNCSTAAINNYHLLLLFSPSVFFAESQNHRYPAQALSS